MAKDLSTLTPEELMALAKKPIKVKRKKEMSPVKDFIISADLLEGDAEIPGIVIYDRYIQWCKANSIVPLNMVKFFGEFKFYFPKRATNKGAMYTLSPKGFDLSPGHLSKLNSEYQKRISRGSKKDKEKSKKDRIKKSTTV